MNPLSAHQANGSSAGRRSVHNRQMPNIASLLNAEVTRLARKELRAAIEVQKKTIAAQRSELVSLKRRVLELEKAVKALSKAAGRQRSEAAQAGGADDAETTGLRFRASGMASNRRRLGLSAAEFGLLVGATGQSVYAWEAGTAKPRAKSLAAIASLRGVGKREVAKLLEQLKSK